MITRSLSYTTNYYYSLNSKELNFHNYACFSSLYKQTMTLPFDSKNYGSLGVKVYFDKELNNEMRDNYCLLDDSELQEYIKWIKETTGFNFKICDKIEINDGFSDFNHRILRVEFKKRYPYEIRLISALIRNIYEFPYNVMVKSAFLMNNIEEFKHLDYTQRFCIAVNSIDGYNTGHSVFSYDGVDFYNGKSIKERYLESKGNEKNVQSFMLISKQNLKFTRSDGIDNNWCNDEEDGEEDEPQIFDSLEDNLISDELKNLFLNNYEIIKKNYE